jgi:hypothetical protein
MQICRSIGELPMRLAVYAIYGGSYPPGNAYIGIGEKLRNRIRQHLVLRDSSVATTAALAGLRVEHVTGVIWWEQPAFTLKPAPPTGGGMTGLSSRQPGGSPTRSSQPTLRSPRPATRESAGASPRRSLP